MNPLVRSAIAASLFLLAACQQAVRPNLTDVLTPVESSPPAQWEPLPETARAPAPMAVAPDPVFGSGEEVFARLRSGIEAEACNSGGEMARRWQRRFSANPTAFARQLAAALPLMDYVVGQIELAQLPSVFALIPLIESNYRANAVGVGAPLGLWQMIPSTARNHGVVIKSGYDGRLSPIESTHAALSYLDTLQAMMGRWPATVMAYNAGENRVRAALARAAAGDPAAGTRHPPGLADVTYEYVAKLQALSCLIADPARAGIELPLQARFERMRELTMDADIDSVEQFAKRQGIDAKVLRGLNPAYRGGRVATGAPRRILVPASALVATAAPPPPDAPASP